jgi:hypothetical protein
MKKLAILCSIFVVTFCLSGCQSAWYLFLDCFVEVAPDRFTFEESNTQLSIPVFASHSIENSNKDIRRLIIIVHGAGLNAEKSYETGYRIAEELGESKNLYMVIAPQFLEGIEPEEKGLLFWGRQWRSGGMSLSEELNKGLPSVSSYEVMDRLIRIVTERNREINQIIVLGHSAGGQFVSRYAAINNNHEDLKKQGVSIYYVAANPSSYLYLNATRYQLSSNGEILESSRDELANCDGYNDYKYGLENLYGYAKSISKQDIRFRLTNRPVVFLLGQKDTERSWSLDKSCEVEVQGKNRYERGLLYKHHLFIFSNDIQNSNHHWVTIAGLGHDAREMFTHTTFIKKLKALTY